MFVLSQSSSTLAGKASKQGHPTPCAVLLCTNLQVACSSTEKDVAEVFVTSHLRRSASFCCSPPGGVFTDSMGRHSKRLQLQSGKQVVVRKMACHSGFAYGAFCRFGVRSLVNLSATCCR
jgi:hypothetical protein